METLVVATLNLEYVPNLGNIELIEGFLLPKEREDREESE